MGLSMNTIAKDGSDVYIRKPESTSNGIPIFSLKDIYIENYEKIAGDHVSQISETQENPFMEEELWVSLEASTREYIKRHVAKGSRILDVGVGLGRLLEPLTEYERFGVDISLEYLSIAKSRGIEVALAKIEELPYTPEFFDAIVICDVLEHVFDLNFCCERILACLRPGGVLIVRVPYREDLSAYLDEQLPYEFVHLRNFDESSLRLHFQKIFGLHYLESASTTPYLQGTPRLKLRLLPEVQRSRLAAFAKTHPEFGDIENALKVSEESFQSWIYGLKSNNREIFNEVSNDLILGIDINAVFLKPYEENADLSRLRVGSNTILNIDANPSNAEYKGLGRDFLKFRNDFEENLRDLREKTGFQAREVASTKESLRDSIARLEADSILLAKEFSNLKKLTEYSGLPLIRRVFSKVRNFFG
jgi:2-polyprenyl-3-methyl-5-hydroxy-6-metoxy-1,4-benzoquinol methylase